MKIQYYIVCATVLCAAAACSVKEPAAVPVQEVEEVVAAAETVAPGSATVLFDEEMIALIEEDLAAGSLETKSDGLNAVLRSLGIVRMERVFPDAGEYEERTRREGLHRFYEVEFDPSVPVTKAVDELSCVPGIEKVECHRPIALRGFNDPMLSRQWHYINTGTEGADVDVEGVWSNYTVGSRDVIVSVVDEGVCYTHPDLADNCWDDGSGHHGYNFVKSSYNITWSDASDVGHGTHVAGIISAVNNNGTGICGLAGGDYAAGIGGVRLMSCQIFAGDSGASDSGCGRAIKWGADHGALISQNSWGFYADSNNDGTVSSSELATFKTYTIPSAIKAAVDYFIKYAGCDNEGNQKEDSPMQGGLVIFAAGNENIDFDPICAYEPVISVGAFGSNGKKASYSNYGDWVDFGAPGGDGSKYILSTLPTNIASSGYGGSGWMGTSMACPHVSGVAALLVSYYGGEGFTAERCRELLTEGAVEDYFTANRPIGRKVDALNSFLYGGKAGDPRAPVIIWESDLPKELHAHETFDVDCSVTDPGGYDFTVALDQEVRGVTLSGSAGSYRIHIDGPASATGTNVVTVVATNSEGASASLALVYNVLPNHAPTVTANLTPQLVYLRSSKAMDLSTVFSDPDGETPVYSAVSTNAEVASVSVNEAMLTISGLRKGDVSVSMTATDLLGETGQTSVQVVVKDPDQPVDVYPLPVESTLYVRNDVEGASVPTEVTLYSMTGAKVLSETKQSNVFNPRKVDVSALAPGQYLLSVSYGKKTYKQVIVKI